MKALLDDTPTSSKAGQSVQQNGLSSSESLRPFDLATSHSSDSASLSSERLAFRDARLSLVAVICLAVAWIAVRLCFKSCATIAALEELRVSPSSLTFRELTWPLGDIQITLEYSFGSVAAAEADSSPRMKVVEWDTLFGNMKDISGMRTGLLLPILGVDFRMQSGFKQIS